jgi:VCBS repeat-containing protein
VEVSDGSLTAGPAAATITFTNQNDAPALGNNSLTLTEGATVVLTAADLSATDVDNADPSLTFTVSNVLNGQFELSGVPTTTFTQADVTAGNVTFVHDGSEAAPSYDVEVSDGALTTGPVAATITFTNQNDAPALGNNSLTLTEGATVVLTAADLSATDVDNPDPGLSFTVSNVQNGQFELSGVPTTTFTQADVTAGNVSFVHDGGQNAPSYDVEVSDGSLTAGPAAATITFTNQNDAPVVNDQTLGPLDESSALGTVVGTVAASDVDAGQSLSYAITAGNTGGTFAIDASTGEITVATPAALNFETTPTFNLTVQVTDDGTPSLSDTATVTINLNDLDEAPVIADAVFTVDENAANGTAVGTVPVAEPDANDSYGYAITAGDPGGAFGIDNAGNITVADGSQLDFEAQSSYTISVRVSDDDGYTDVAAIAIGLNDLVETPIIVIDTDPDPTSDDDEPNGEAPDSTPPAEDPPASEPEEAVVGEPAGEIPPTVPAAFQEIPAERVSQRAPLFTAPVIPRTPSDGVQPAQETRRELSGQTAYEPTGIKLGLIGNERMVQALDRIRQEMTDDARDLADAYQVTVSAAEGAALMLSLGWLGALLRSGSLAAIAFSALPMWRRVDPLAVLTISEEERLKREQELRSAQELEDRTEARVGDLLDDPVEGARDRSQEVT